MMLKRMTLILSAGLLLFGLRPAPVAGAAIGNLTFGGDLRFRQTSLEDVPLRNGHSIPYLSFFRIRPRVWANYQFTDDIAVYGKFTNEFRKWMEPEHKDSYKFPSEFLVDNLYLDVKNLAGGNLDLRIGRQNLIYGTGKIILDGTPGDGSRTIYFNAVKASWKGFDDMTIDLLGIYDPAEDPLVINGEDLDLTNLTHQDVHLDADEIGAGIYLKHKGFKENWPFEAYYLFKQEQDFRNATGEKIHSVSYSTFGARVMPKFSDRWSGNLEAAFQLGSQGDKDLSGYMVDAKLTVDAGQVGRLRPKASIGMYLLSGDDPDTQDDEGWRAPFARWPQFSELYIYSYAADRGSVADWQNLALPYFQCSTPLGSKITSTALIGYMWALQEDQTDPAADGKGRGMLFTWWNKFQLAKGLFRDNDSVAGHLLIEAVKPGSYYVTDTTALFFRWEFLYSFK